MITAVIRFINRMFPRMSNNMQHIIPKIGISASIMLNMLLDQLSVTIMKTVSKEEPMLSKEVIP